MQIAESQQRGIPYDSGACEGTDGIRGRGDRTHEEVFVIGSFLDCEEKDGRRMKKCLRNAEW